MVLFGGDGNIARSDTWEWDGVNWTLRSPTTSPSGRSGVALAYDIARQRVVLFGGGNLNDTWEWDGTNWSRRTPATSPPARSNHALAYDAVRQRVVLFGGYSLASSSLLSDTWEWDGATWLLRTPTTSPSAHDYHAMTYDPVRQRVVLFGGRTGANPDGVADLWEWSGTTWTLRTASTAPPPRTSPSLGYDGARQRVLLFGGYDGSSANLYLSDTWEWDGTSWSERTPTTSPSPRSDHALAYDALRQRLVLFGGLGGSGVYFGDTWEFQP